MSGDAAKQKAVRLRHETALRYRELMDRHSEEEAELRDDYLEHLHALGLSHAEVDREYLLMVNEATPKAGQHRYEMRELLRRHLAGEALSAEELDEVEAVLEAGQEDTYLNWRSEAEKEAGQ
jgi:hypothetical protein